jgi:dipeptidyl aminopeptidase/acylaminoacyl peptidase
VVISHVFKVRATIAEWQHRLAIALSLSILGVSSPGAGSQQADISKMAGGQPVEVTDTIRMVKLGSPVRWDFKSGIAVSPDDTQFVAVLRKGNPKQNTNEYSLLLWHTEQVFNSRPDALLTMSSSSNREAIKAVSWLADNRTLLFLGEQPGEMQQLYSFDVQTRHLSRLTNSKTNLRSYSADARGETVLYVSEEPIVDLFDEQSERYGLVFSSTQYLLNTLLGRRSGPNTGKYEIYRWSKGDPDRPKRVRGNDTVWSNIAPDLSPDGKYAAMPSAFAAASIPRSWKDYTDPKVHEWSAEKSSAEIDSPLRGYVLLNLDTGEVIRLINAPVAPSGDPQTLWALDGHSIVVTNTYLPLVGVDAEERQVRRSTRFIAEINVATGESIKVAAMADGGGPYAPAWHSDTGRLQFRVGTAEYKYKRKDLILDSPKPSLTRVFAKQEGRWLEVPASPIEDLRSAIGLEESFESSPKLTAPDPVSHERRVFYDLNPQFHNLKFAKISIVRWTGSDGHGFKGGLYFPVDYEPGRRYPLVIQTHGFNPNYFTIDGYWTTAYAAQPLAGKDIMVLQAAKSDNEDDDVLGTPKELAREVGSYEGAIKTLSEKGLIDRNRVGIIGFSHTCGAVKYALTHSKYHFAAATVTDGTDFGYFGYMTAGISNGAIRAESERLIGAAPFGAGLRLWMARSPGFNVDKVHTPIRIVALNTESAFGEWEWFAALTVLKKPVDMVFIHDGFHMLQRPSDRMVSQQGTVDWFQFWLQGYEDPDPAKSEQYKRWEALRARQIAQSGASAVAKKTVH